MKITQKKAFQQGDTFNMMLVYKENDQPADLKKLSSHNNITRHAKHAAYYGKTTHER